MRVMALLVTALLVAAPAWSQSSAQQTPPSQTPSPSSSDVSAKPSPALELPVSLAKIRGALERPAPRILFRGIDDKTKADFRVEIVERQKIEDLLASLNFKSGPTPPGGVYGWEQQRVMFPSSSNPFAQPYAAFGQGQLVTILLENLIGKYIAGKAINAVSNARRESAEQAARRQVVEAIADYCSAQPNAGTGIRLCASAPPIR